jgi:hypothetical protein
MLHTTVAVALTIGLLADSSPARAPESPPPDGTSRGFETPPPGTPADQALWRSSHDMNNDLVIVQHTTSRLQLQARGALERLLDPAGRGKLSKEGADKLAASLTERLTASGRLMVSTWPVSKQRVCGYELMNLEGVMHGTDSPAKERQLEDARRDLNGCMEKATSVFAAVRRANDELVAATAEAERALGPPAAKSPAAPAKK